MSSPNTPKIIIKRRPSRADPEAAGHAEPSSSQPPVRDLEDEPQPRGTVDPSAAQPHAYPIEDEDGNLEDEPQPRDTADPSAVQPHAYPIEDEDGDEPVPQDPVMESEARADGENASPEAVAEYPVEDEEGVATPPPAGAKTARPKQAKAKAKKEKPAAKKPAAKKKGATKKKAAAAAGGQEGQGQQQQQQQPAAAAAAASRASPAPAAPAKKKKRPVRKVSLLNVEKVESVPEGVNTPRSVALCLEHGIATRELRPRSLEDFQGKNVNRELAELRYNSYEKRRQAHMAVLVPKRQRQAAEDEENQAGAQPSDQQQQQQQQQQQGTPREQFHNGYGPAEGEDEQPNERIDNETLEMQRQFEEQHNRILEQERRQAAAAQNPSVRRGSTPRAAGRSPSHSGSSPRLFSHASAGRNSGVGLPASAAKIQSRCKVENRQPNEAERVAMEEILERDMYQQEIRERQVMLEDNRQLMLIEQRINKEKAAADRVQKINEDREREIERKYRERQNRDATAWNRRTQLEEERRCKIEDDLAEKEARVHANDPYTSVLSRRRYSEAQGSRRDSGHRDSTARRDSGEASQHEQDDVAAAQPHPYDENPEAGTAAPAEHGEYPTED